MAVESMIVGAKQKTARGSRSLNQESWVHLWAQSASEQHAMGTMPWLGIHPCLLQSLSDVLRQRVPREQPTSIHRHDHEQ